MTRCFHGLLYMDFVHLRVDISPVCEQYLSFLFNQTLWSVLPRGYHAVLLVEELVLKSKPLIFHDQQSSLYSCLWLLMLADNTFSVRPCLQPIRLHFLSNYTWCLLNRLLCAHVPSKDYVHFFKPYFAANAESWFCKNAG